MRVITDHVGLGAGGQGQDLFLRRTRRKLPGDPAIRHDENPIGHSQDLGKFAGDEDDRHTSAGEAADQRVDRDLRTDVDSSSRFVEQHHTRGGGQPFGQNDLLLIASRQCSNLLVRIAADDLERFEDPRNLGAHTRSAGGEDSADRQQRIVENGLGEHQTCALAVLRDQGQTPPDALSSGRDAHCLAVEVQRTAGERLGSEDRRQQLRPPRTLQAGQPEDLTGAQVEGDAVKLFIASAGHREHGVTDLRSCLGLRKERADGPADHGAHEPRLIHLGRRFAGDESAVLHHGDRVAEVEDLLQSVRDVDDRHALGFESLDDPVEDCNLIV